MGLIFSDDASHCARDQASAEQQTFLYLVGMFRITALLVLVFAVNSLFAQTTLGPKDPRYYQYRPKILVLQEDFDDNRRWWIDSGMVSNTARIENGQFHLDPSDTFWFINVVPFNDLKDFEIEFSAKVPKKIKLAWLFFGKKDECAESGFVMRFNNRGTVRFYGLSYGAIMEGKKSYFVTTGNRNDFVRYNIRKVGHQYYVFADGVYQFEHPYVPLRGSYLMLGQYHTSVIFDYIRISYLD